MRGAGRPAVPPASAVTPAAAPQSQSKQRSNLVLPRSPLVGRDHEAAAIQSLLLQDAIALLTLTGPSGIGKTRLALHVAANLLDHFVDGVYFVALAPLRDPEQVCAAIAQTLGVQEPSGRPLVDSLYRYLRDKQLLLVTDNFEQVLPAAPHIGGLLCRCRGVKVLATSRTKLHLYGEHEYPVPPLALPHFSSPDNLEQPELADLRPKLELEALAAVPAVALFVQRAVEVEPDFALTAANAAAVAAICIWVEGIPLAIELAAAKLTLFSPPALLARLKQRLTLLTGGPADMPARQRTLRDEIAWIYELLAQPEQLLFRRLAIFSGGFTLRAAQAVGDPEGDLGIIVLDGVATLLDQNLLKRSDRRDGEPRFGMLETVREFGLEQLAVHGETDAAQRQHAFYFVHLAKSIGPSLVHKAFLRHAQQDYAGGQSLLDEAKAIFEEVGAAWEVADVLPRPAAKPAGLTAREIEVLRLFVEGLTYAEIADRLVVSRRTVNAHVTSIYGKLDVNNRTAAARVAAKYRLI